MKFVIGDIHGEITKLKQLMGKIEKYPIERLVFIGDCLDKGENSKETLRFLNELSGKYQCNFILGDHEYTWLKYIHFGEYPEFILKYGGKTTMRDFGITKLSSQSAYKKIYLPFKVFFNNLKKFTILGDYIVSHSGINPAVVGNNNWEELDEKEFVWQRDEFLKMRMLIKGKKFIIGHTAFRFPWHDGFKIAIDTGAAYSRTAPLTAFEIKKGFFINHFGQRQNLSDLDILARPVIIRKMGGNY